MSLIRRNSFLYHEKYRSAYMSTLKKVPGSRYVKPASGVRKYVIDRYFGFIQDYLKLFGKRFPRVYRVYQVFSIGVTDIYKDTRQYLNIATELRGGKPVRQLTRKQLEIYYQMPKAMVKVAPVLLISAIPFANYVVFPVAYMFPRQFLSQHFWSIQEKFNFALIEHRQKLSYFRPVFRRLQSKAMIIKDVDLQSTFLTIVHKLGSGTHPNVEEILSIKPLFVDGLFSLQSLSSRHLSLLCRMHYLNTFLGRRRRLYNHAGFIREIDLAIDREGLSNMGFNELSTACFIRGLNPVGLLKSELITWLNDWIIIAKSSDRYSLSLLLHCPIFLSYNHQTNWSLIR